MPRVRTLVVIGSGPGIGVHVASHFASRGFNKIALMARNEDQLKKDSAAVQKVCVGVDVQTYAVDVTDSAALCRALHDIIDDLGPPEVLFFSAARVTPSNLLEVDYEELPHGFKITIVTLDQTAKCAIPQLIDLADAESSAKTSLLVTSSHISWDPELHTFVLAIAKAAQRNLTEPVGPLELLRLPNADIDSVTQSTTDNITYTLASLEAVAVDAPVGPLELLRLPNSDADRVIRLTKDSITYTITSIEVAAVNAPVGPLELLRLPNSEADRVIRLIKDNLTYPIASTEVAAVTAPVGPRELLRLPNSEADRVTR